MTLEKLKASLAADRHIFSVSGLLRFFPHPKITLKKDRIRDHAISKERREREGGFNPFGQASFTANG